MGSKHNEPRIEKLQVAIVGSATAESQKWAEPVVARLATEFWRLSRRFQRAAAAGELNAVRDSIGRIEDVFAEHQIRAVDHDGEQYDPGLQVEVLHQRDGDGALIVLETVRPTITLAGRILQHGQVVVGPDDQSNSKAQT